MKGFYKVIGPILHAFINHSNFSDTPSYVHVILYSLKFRISHKRFDNIGMSTEPSLQGRYFLLISLSKDLVVS